MNTIEVLEGLRTVTAQTKGVYPADRIPKVWCKPTAIVVNTDIHTRPGAHWVAIYVGEDGLGVFFDSYGLPPIVPQHHNRLRRNCKSFRWNVKSLQSPTSKVCGEYCIMFLHFMARGRSLDAFCGLFSSNKSKNDCAVTRFYEKNISRPKRRQPLNYINSVEGSGHTHNACVQSCIALNNCYL